MTAFLIVSAIIAGVWALAGFVQVANGPASQAKGFVSLCGASALGFIVTGLWDHETTMFASLLVWDSPKAVLHNVLGLAALAFLIMAVFHFLLRQDEAAD